MTERVSRSHAKGARTSSARGPSTKAVKLSMITVKPSDVMYRLSPWPYSFPG